MEHYLRLDKTSDEWKNISNVIDDYFNPKSGIYHYLSMAKTNYREYFKGNIVRLKKYFYVLRPLLNCEYIREYQKSPPMLFKDLFCYLEGEVKNEVLKLLELKIGTSELGEGKAVTSINRYIEDKISEFDKYAKAFTPINKSGWGNLNDVFLSAICDYK